MQKIKIKRKDNGKGEETKIRIKKAAKGTPTVKVYQAFVLDDAARPRFVLSALCFSL